MTVYTGIEEEYPVASKDVIKKINYIDLRNKIGTLIYNELHDQRHWEKGTLSLREVAHKIITLPELEKYFKENGDFRHVSECSENDKHE